MSDLPGRAFCGSQNLRRVSDGRGARSIVRPLLLTASLAVLLACPKAPTVNATWTAQPAARDSRPDAPAEPVSSEPSPSALIVHMHAQLATVDAMRDAVIVGDRAHALELAARLRQQINALESDDDEETHLTAVSREAVIDPASPLPDIAVTVARLAAACGACHSAAGVAPSFDDVDVPPLDDRLESAMAVHKWAAERMWEGLIGPNDERWRRGTATFVALPRCDALYPNGPAERRALCLDATRLIQRSHIRESAPSRTALYGRLLATCAHCHGSEPA